MARLSTLKPTIGRLRPSVAFMPDGEKERDRLRSSLPWRQWYQSARWKALRLAVLIRDHFKCQRDGCGRICGRKGEAVVDHRIPHHGDEALFFDETNLWTLCKPCHDGWKQRMEKRQA
jgi:5-methylcytosine-specific restriction endonuclease McrA